MSGITVSEDAVNLYYYMKAKSAVRPRNRPAHVQSAVRAPAAELVGWAAGRLL